MSQAPLVFRGARWDFARPLVQGVLNLTPDSFSDGGRYLSLERAVERAERMVEEGADCIDVGGESTRPNARPVSEDEECRRVIPVLEVLSERLSVPISIDTFKASVARRAVEAGAEIVNDVSGGRFDAEMLAAVDALGVAYICGHVPADDLSEVHATQCESAAIVAKELAERCAMMSQGMRSRLILDPCLGFGKSLACNIELMHGGGTLRERLGAPVLIGASRKRFLGELTGKTVEGRDAATVGASLAAIAGGANMVRVHDVGMVVDAIRVFSATPEAVVGE